MLDLAEMQPAECVESLIHIGSPGDYMTVVTTPGARTHATKRPGCHRPAMPPSADNKCFRTRRQHPGSSTTGRESHTGSSGLWGLNECKGAPMQLVKRLAAHRLRSASCFEALTGATHMPAEAE